MGGKSRSEYVKKACVVALEGADVPVQGGMSSLSIALAAKGKAKVSGVPGGRHEGDSIGADDGRGRLLLHPRDLR